MARKLRVEYPGAIYHVMSHGDCLEPIFKDDPDRERFVSTLGEACAKTGWQVHALCLMDNHLHLEWIASRLHMGTKTYLAHLLYWEQPVKTRYDTID